MQTAGVPRGARPASVLREEAPERAVGLAQLAQRPARRLAGDRELELLAPDGPEDVEGHGAGQLVERGAGARDDEAGGRLAEKLGPRIVGRSEVQSRAQPASQAGLGD